MLVSHSIPVQCCGLVRYSQAYFGDHLFLVGMACDGAQWRCLNRQIPGVSRRGSSKGGFQEPELFGNMAPNLFHGAMLWWLLTVCYIHRVLSFCVHCMKCEREAGLGLRNCSRWNSCAGWDATFKESWTEEVICMPVNLLCFYVPFQNCSN